MTPPALTPDQEAYLLGERVARLATIDESGGPRVLPVCFALVAGRIYVPLDRKPKRVPVERLQRVRDISHNPAVCFVVDHYEEDWRRLSWLQVRGIATLVLPGAEQERAVAALRERYEQYRGMAIDDSPVIRITPQHATGWSWSGPTG